MLSIVVLFVQQIRLPKKEGRNAPSFRGRPVVPCPSAFQPPAGAGSHLYPAQQGSARRRSLAWRGLIRLSWVLAAVMPCRLLPCPPDGYIIPQGASVVNRHLICRTNKVSAASSQPTRNRQLVASFQLPARRCYRSPGRARKQAVCAGAPTARLADLAPLITYIVP